MKSRHEKCANELARSDWTKVSAPCLPHSVALASMRAGDGTVAAMPREAFPFAGDMARGLGFSFQTCGA